MHEMQQIFFFFFFLSAKFLYKLRKFQLLTLPIIVAHYLNQVKVFSPLIIDNTIVLEDYNIIIQSFFYLIEYIQTNSHAGI